MGDKLTEARVGVPEPVTHQTGHGFVMGYDWATHTRTRDHTRAIPIVSIM